MTALQKQFAAARDAMAASLVERDDEIELVLTGLVADEHVLLVGPPGVAKSMLVDSLLPWLGGTRFSYLMTKFTTPDELFGPVDVPALLKGETRRVTTNRLAEAEYAFLDEAFRGSSAALNCLLKVMNERVYDPGDGVEVRIPLKLLVGAANTWPDSENGQAELGALFDRFLLRKAVQPVRTKAGWRKLVQAADLAPKMPAPLAPGDLDRARAEARALPWADLAWQVYEAIKDELARAGVKPGDRRFRKATGAVRAAAWLAGADEVQPGHLLVCQHVLWDDPAEGPAKAAEIVTKNADPAGAEIGELLLQADGVVASPLPKGDTREAVKRATQLQDIKARLSELVGPRAKTAAAHVAEQIKDLHRQSLKV